MAKKVTKAVRVNPGREERLAQELRRLEADLRGREQHGPPPVEWCVAQADYIDKVLGAGLSEER